MISRIILRTLSKKWQKPNRFEKAFIFSFCSMRTVETETNYHLVADNYLESVIDRLSKLENSYEGDVDISLSVSDEHFIFTQY